MPERLTPRQRAARNNHRRGWCDGIQAFIAANEHLWGNLLVDIPNPPVPKDVTPLCAGQCPRCADTGLTQQGFGRLPKPCACRQGTIASDTLSTPKEEKQC
jgi:hypothetical protein